MGHHQPHLPGPGLALAELHHAVGLQRLQRGQPQPHPGSAAGRAADTVVDHLQPERAVGAAQPHRHAGRARRACRALRTASLSTDWASGSSAAGTSAPLPSTSVRPEVGVGGGQALHLGHQRRPGGPRGAAERPLQRGPQVAERRLGLRGAALAGRARAARRRRRAPSRPRTGAGSRPRGSPGRDRCAAPAGGPSRTGWRRSGPPRPARPPCPASTAAAVGVVERGRWTSSRSARMTPNARSAAAIGAHTRRAGSDTSAANSSGTCAAEVADHLDHPVLAQRLGGDRRRLDGDVGAGELRRCPCRARRRPGRAGQALS